MQSFCLLFFQILQSIATKETEAYGLAGAVAEEVLSAIRIVAAYAGEAKEVMRYEENLKTARSVGIMKGLVSGLGQGLVWIIAFGVIGLAFWYGGELVRDEDIMYTAGIVLQVRLIYITPNYSNSFTLLYLFFVQIQFAMFAGMRNLGWSVSALEAIYAARGAAVGVFRIIDAVRNLPSVELNTDAYTPFFLVLL